MNELELALKQRQDKFIENRTIIATEVTRFLESIASIPDEEKCHMKLPTGTTVQEILPELWNEPFNIEVYNKQKAEFDSCVESVVNRCDILNAKALECLQ